MAALVTLGLRTLAFIALVALICVPLELLWPRVAGRLAPRSWLVDVGYLAVGALFLSQLLEPILAALTRALPSPPPSTSTVRWLGSFFGAELLGYVAHRLLHQVPWLWRFHAVHHAPRHIDFWKGWRQHPLDLGLHTLLGALPGLLLGCPLSSLGWLVLLRRIYTAFLHANVALRSPWLEHVIALPAFHYSHHALDAEHSGVNYAGLFPFIDRLFGTWRDPDDVVRGHALDSAAV